MQIQPCRSSHRWVLSVPRQSSELLILAEYDTQESIYETGRGGRGEIMTVEGAMQKTGLLMAIAMVAAAHTWMQIFSGNAAAAMAALSTSKARISGDPDQGGKMRPYSSCEHAQMRYLCIKACSPTHHLISSPRDAGYTGEHRACTGEARDMPGNAGDASRGEGHEPHDGMQSCRA